jgi:hypothetical protein
VIILWKLGKMAEIFSALKNLVTQEVFFVGLLLINAAVLGYFWVQSRRGTPAAPTVWFRLSFNHISSTKNPNSKHQHQMGRLPV